METARGAPVESATGGPECRCSPGHLGVGGRVTRATRTGCEGGWTVQGEGGGLQGCAVLCRGGWLAERQTFPLECVCRKVPTVGEGLGVRGGGAQRQWWPARPTFVVVCKEDECALYTLTHPHCAPRSCSTVTARTTPSSTGFTKRRRAEDIGSTESPIGERSTKKKAAPGRKGRGTQKKRAARSPKGKGMQGTKRNTTKKAFTSVTRGTAAVWTEERGCRKKSAGKGSPRWVSVRLTPRLPQAALAQEVHLNAAGASLVG